MIEGDLYESTYESIVSLMDPKTRSHFNGWLFDVTREIADGHLIGDQVTIDEAPCFRCYYRVAYLKEKPVKLYLIYDLVGVPPPRQG
ncbi:MAG: hypothetical protein MUC92_09560 [Fimbriimonadaceae bacterium]|nr:hypothetical protein [Fimbriimonadaceae bacterium]